MRYKSYVVEFNKVQYKATMLKISLFLLHGAVCTYFRLNYSMKHVTYLFMSKRQKLQALFLWIVS